MNTPRFGKPARDHMRARIKELEARQAATDIVIDEMIALAAQLVSTVNIVKAQAASNGVNK